MPKKLNNDLDKWIISRLQTLNQEVSQAMEIYNLVQATRPLFDFVDELSTWYVRRSRDRFKGEDKDDRAAAIATLGYVLKTLAKIIAPFTPMTAEIIYQEFINNEESVHLTSWPKFEKKLVDNKVLEQMSLVRKIVEAAHALRSKTGFKVRQPLAQIIVTKNSGLVKDYLNIIAEELNVEEVNIVSEIKMEPNWEQSVVDNFQIALDTNITPELKDKGVIREIIRTINALRKEAGLQPQDKPSEVYQTDSDYLLGLMKKYNSELVKGTSAGDLVLMQVKPSYQTELDIEGAKIILGIK